METKKEMINYLLNQFKKNNKNSKFLIEDLKDYKEFLNRKTLTEIKEIYNRQSTINSVSDDFCRKECCIDDLF